MTLIQDKFNSLLQNGLNLGETVGEEESLPDGGAIQLYRFGAIYFHPRVGEPFECHGLILQTYRDLGEQASPLGYPVSDEGADPNVLLGRISMFEGGTLTFNPAVGVVPRFDDVPVSPEVVLKIVDALPIELGDGAEVGLGELAAMLGRPAGDPFTASLGFILPGITFRRLFDSVSPLLITARVDEAKQADPSYRPPRFENYLSIPCPDGFDPEPLVNALRLGAGVVQFAYTRRPSSNPGVVVATNNPLFVEQRHLTAINVRRAWDKGADGSQSEFIDIEQGWITRHEDLQPLELLFGVNRFDSTGHGTAILGVVAGLDNDRGIIGIAPKTHTRVVSYFNPTQRRRPTRQTRSIESAIALAVTQLNRGDVLLIEIETPTSFDGGPGHEDNGTVFMMPAEVDEPVFQIIELATRHGITVVEAAANGNVNLDAFRAGGNAVLSRNGPGARDSGAILVGGCTTRNQRWTSPDLTPDGLTIAGSNFGSRVDCCAWAERIVTTGDRQAPFAPNGYLKGPAPRFLSGTSGASAIIAGVCLLIQDLAVARGRKLDPRVIRAMLGNASNGTPVPGIGPIPNMGNIVQNHFP